MGKRGAGGGGKTTGNKGFGGGSHRAGGDSFTLPFLFARMTSSFIASPAAGGVSDSQVPLVLVLCTGNSCRSHMAEGLLRARAGGLLRVESAGSRPAGYVHPEAIAVMAELGIDISGHRSKHLAEFLAQPVDTVITVCGRADEACPDFPGHRHRYHWPFDDPAHAVGAPEQVRAEFRRVRDELARVLAAYAAGWVAGHEHAALRLA
jgi:arsenate reductase (thioredoxin)